VTKWLRWRKSCILFGFDSLSHQLIPIAWVWAVIAFRLDGIVMAWQIVNLHINIGTFLVFNCKALFTWISFFFAVWYISVPYALWKRFFDGHIYYWNSNASTRMLWVQPLNVLKVFLNSATCIEMNTATKQMMLFR